MPSGPPRSSGPAGEHLDVAGLVGHLDGEQLHDLPEMRVDAAEEAGRDQQGGLLVFDQVGHDLDDRRLDLGRQRRTARPSPPRSPGPTGRPRPGRRGWGPGRSTPRSFARSAPASGARRPRRGRPGRPDPTTAPAAATTGPPADLAGPLGVRASGPPGPALDQTTSGRRPVAPGPGPRPQVQLQVGIPAADLDPGADAARAGGPVEQQVAAPVEAQAPQGR